MSGWGWQQDGTWLAQRLCPNWTGSPEGGELLRFQGWVSKLALSLLDRQRALARALAGLVRSASAVNASGQSAYPNRLDSVGDNPLIYQGVFRFLVSDFHWNNALALQVALSFFTPSAQNPFAM